MGEKILVVEDNELNLKLFCDLLRAHAYEAEPVRDGREAVARARSFRPDLVIMDIQMPHVSGLELIEQLKADPELRPVPIMAVTAYAAKGDEERIREAGAEGYVSKPISLMRFIEAVRALLAAPRPVPAQPEPTSEAAEQVRVSRSFETAAETLFDAWIDPEVAGRWLFRTPDGECVKVEVEATAGGRYEIVERREGEEVLHTGVYEAVERPHRLAFTLQVPKYSAEEARVEVRIEAAEAGCELVLTQSLPTHSPVPAEQIERGWAALLDQLEAAVTGEEGEPPDA